MRGETKHAGLTRSESLPMKPSATGAIGGLTGTGLGLAYSTLKRELAFRIQGAKPPITKPFNPDIWGSLLSASVGYGASRLLKLGPWGTGLLTAVGGMAPILADVAAVATPRSIALKLPRRVLDLQTREVKWLPTKEALEGFYQGKYALGRSPIYQSGFIGPAAVGVLAGVIAGSRALIKLLKRGHG